MNLIEKSQQKFPDTSSGDVVSIRLQGAYQTGYMDALLETLSYLPAPKDERIRPADELMEAKGYNRALQDVLIKLDTHRQVLCAGISLAAFTQKNS